MPAKSKAQQRLMAAAEHGASFALAKQVRASMTPQQLHDFARGPMTGKPAHVPRPRTYHPAFVARAAAVKAAHAHLSMQPSFARKPAVERFKAIQAHIRRNGY